MSRGRTTKSPSKGVRNQRLRPSGRGGSPTKVLLALGGGAVLLAAGLWLAAGRPGLEAPSARPTGFPPFAYNSSVTLAGYQAAARYPEGLNWIPCYCGCVYEQHRSLRDCFYKPDGAYNDHASNCHVCVEESTDMAKGLDGGKPMKEVRAAIEAKFGRNGGGTLTPPVT